MHNNKRILSPFAVLVVAVCALFAGAALLPLLPTSIWPENPRCSFTISFNYPGASQRVVEGKVTSVLENALSSISGITKISSQSNQGGGTISIDFGDQANPDIVRLELSSVLRQVASDLPAEVSPPIVSSNSQNDITKDNSNTPFLVFSVNSMHDASEIRPLAEKVLKTSFANLTGLSEVRVTGGENYELELSYDYNQLAATGITPQQIADVINETFSTSYIDKYKLFFNDSLSVEFLPDDLFITCGDSVSVQLKSLVTGKIKKQQPQSLFRINGRNSVYAQFYASSQGDVLALKKSILSKIKSLEPKIANDVDIVLIADESEYIEKEIMGLTVQVCLAFGILILIIYLTTLSLRYLFAVMLCIFVNLFSAVILYHFFGVGINIMTVSALSVVSGLIADNIIVAYNHLKTQKNLNVILPITAATLTTVAALFVVIFVNKEIKESLGDFCIVVIINLLISVVVALTVVPAIVRVQTNHLTLKAPNIKRKRKAVQLLNLYKRILNFELRYKLLFVVLFVAMFGGALWLFINKVQSGSYYNYKEELTLTVSASMPCGSAFEETDAVIRKMEAFLTGFDRIRQFQTEIYNSRQAVINIRFTNKGRRSAFPFILRSKIVEKALQFGAGSWSVYGLPDNGNFSNVITEFMGGYSIKAQGFNYDKLLAIADCVKCDLQKFKRVIDVNINPEETYFKDDYFEYLLKPDLDKLANLNIPLSEFCSIFHDDISCGQIMVDGNMVQMVLRAQNNAENEIYSLLNRSVTLAGKELRVAQVANIEQVRAQQSINRENRQYQLCLQFDYLGSSKRASRLRDSISAAYNTKVPPGYSFAPSTYNYGWDNFPYQAVMLVIIAAIIYFITAILFNSLKYSFVILLLLPTALAGAILTFYLFDVKFDSGGFASFVLLSGLTVNSGIFIIYEFLKIKEVKTDSKSAFFKAFNIKIGAICLTIVSTIAGLMPFIIANQHESFRYTLACGTSGGLLFSLVGLLFLLPLFCLKKR